MRLLILISTVFILVSCVLNPEPQQNKTADNGDYGDYEIGCDENRCWIRYSYNKRDDLDNGKIGLKYNINDGDIKDDAMDSHRIGFEFPLVDTLYLTWYGTEEKKTLKFPIGKDFFDRVTVKSDSIMEIDLVGAEYKEYRYGIIVVDNDTDYDIDTLKSGMVHTRKFEGLNNGYSIALGPLNERTEVVVQSGFQISYTKNSKGE